MTNRANKSIRPPAALLLAFLGIFVGCRSESDETLGGGTGAIRIAGSWSVTEFVSSDCPDENPVDSYTVTVEQSGSRLTVHTPAGTFSGSIDGNVVEWSGSYPDEGGTTTIQSLRLFASDGGSNMSGSSTWTWNNGAVSCSGTSEITASRS